MSFLERLIDHKLSLDQAMTSHQLPIKQQYLNK